MKCFVKIKEDEILKKHFVTPNCEQRAVILSVNDPVLVIAGAGTGKTWTICQKIHHLIHSGSAHRILGLTFTNKAAKEMKERLLCLKISPRNAQMMTFHRLGLDLLKKFGEHVGLHQNFSLIHQSDKYHILQQILCLDESEKIKETSHIISQIKQFPDWISVPEQIKNDPDNVNAFQQYQAVMQKMNCIDLDDLVFLSFKLVIQPEIQKEIHKIWDYVFIDEYQDTNLIQYHFFSALQYQGRFTAVGDDDQSIYGWRGAHSANLSMLTQDFPDLKILKLQENYRCTKQILSAANHLIAKNSHLFQKKLWSTREGKPDCVEIRESANFEEEVEKTLLKIEQHKYQLKTQAILFRTNFQGLEIEKALRQKGISYFFLGGTSLFEKEVVSNFLCYLRLIANPYDDLAFKKIINIPKRQIGPKKIAEIAQYSIEHHIPLFKAITELRFLASQDQGSIKKFESFEKLIRFYQKSYREQQSIEWIDRLVKDIEYDAWIEDQNPHQKGAARDKRDLADFIRWLKIHFEKNPDLDDIIRKIQILDRLEKKNDDGSRIILGTIHSVKGLEFDGVYVIGCNEGSLPYTEDNLEEERRLFYVALTRAKESLTLSYSHFDKNQERLLKSRFLDELSEGLEKSETHQKLSSWQDLKDRFGLN